MPPFYAIGLSDGAVAAVAYGAVVFYLAKVFVGTVTNGAVILNLAKVAVGTVTNGAVALYLSHIGIGTVTDGAVTFYLSHIGVRTVSDAAVTLYLSYIGIVTVSHLLCLHVGDGQQTANNGQQENTDCKSLSHLSIYLLMFNLLSFIVSSNSRHLLNTPDGTKFLDERLHA